MSRPLILVVGGDPRNTNTTNSGELALEQEFTAIEQELLMAPHRDFRAIFARATTVDDLMRHLNKGEPAIIHIAGHGVTRRSMTSHSLVDSREIAPADEDLDSGIVLLDSQGQPTIVTMHDLAVMIRAAAPSTRVVVLNACYSDTHAQVLCDVVDCAITVAGAIGDEAAKAFSAAFYRAIGNRRSIGNAFSQAVATLDVKRFPDKDMPQCRTRKGVTADDLFLVHAHDAQLPGAPARPCSPGVRTRRKVRGRRIACAALATMLAAAGALYVFKVGRALDGQQDQPVATVLTSDPDRDPAEVPAEPTPVEQRPPQPNPVTTRPGKQGSKARGGPKVPRQPPSPMWNRPRDGAQPDMALQAAPAPDPAGSSIAEVHAPAGPLAPSTKVDATTGQSTARPASASGALSDEAVQQSIQHSEHWIRRCYDDRLATRPTLQGTVTIGFLISPEGHVQSLTAGGLTSEVSSCIARVIKDIEFPRSRRSRGVSREFSFTPRDS